MKLGIMQGRLVPPEANRFQCFPRQRWKDEFAYAEAAGLETIEWIYDAYGEDENPLATDDGLRQIERLCAVHHVQVESVCADWFMDYPLLGVDASTAESRWNRLSWLMNRCTLIGIKRIVIPFVDASAIHDPADFEVIVRGLNSLIRSNGQAGVELHLETSLAPADFAALLARVPHPAVKVNYDAGNSASLGYRPAAEFAAYGGRVGSVHLKDRRLGAGTVPLGTGDTDFDALIAALKTAQYSGDFILQAARGEAGNELQWARGNVSFARRLLQRLRPA